MCNKNLKILIVKVSFIPAPFYQNSDMPSIYVCEFNSIIFAIEAYSWTKIGIANKCKKSIFIYQASSLRQRTNPQHSSVYTRILFRGFVL